MVPSDNPFDSTNVLNIPEFTYEDNTKWQGFHFEKDLRSAVFNLPDADCKSLQGLEAGAFHLDVEDVPVPSLEASSVSSYTTAQDDSARFDEQLEVPAEQESWENIWTFPEVKDVTRRLNLTSWDHFSNGQHSEPGTVYLSEAGAATFDAIVASTSIAGQVAPLVLSDTFLHSLYELALGRSSILFAWKEIEQIFAQTVDSFTVSGCTARSVQNVVSTTASAGAQMKKLSEPERYFFRDRRSTSPGALAFCSTLRSCVTAIQKHVDDQRSEITTILKLQQAHSAVVPLIEVLEWTAYLVQAPVSDVAVLGSLIQSATSIALQYPQFEDILNSIISSTARPLLQELDRDVGLNQRYSAVREEFHTPEGDLWANLLPVEVLHMIHETERTLKLLKDDCPDKLAALSFPGADVGFCLEFSWASIGGLQADADKYERQAKSLLLSCNLGTTYEYQPFQHPGDHVSAVNSPERIEVFKLPDLETALPELHEPDSTYTSALSCLRHGKGRWSTLTVGYTEALTLSISPMLSAQHRLLSYSIFEILFNNQKLLSHLALQHRIQLLGDGMFAARLSIALFDPEQSSGEGQRRTGGTTGLRLQTREAWPPASSELRLVLMGILSEFMSTAGSKQLEDTISFAIRDLSDEELERCRNVDSIHALDFLKVQYRPPNPVLQAVMSSESLKKYDRIFKHLLRILRVKSVAQNLLRGVSHRGIMGKQAPDHRFRVEIQQFVSAVADYCQNVAVNRNWTVFEVTIRDLEKKLQDNDYDGVLRVGYSLERLRERHERTLDAILRALLLKRKQAETMQVMEQIFGVVLGYAAALGKATRDEDIARLYHEEFRALVKRFVGMLRELVTSADAKGVEPGLELVDELLVRLDLTGYWSR